MRYTGSAPAIQPVQSNAPQMFQSLAQRLSAFSTEQDNQLDREMAKKAKEKGLIDAQGKTQITLRDGNTIADEAWNEGAIASHLAAVKLDITDNLTRIEAESARNPEAYTAKARAYSDGLIEGVPEQIRPAVQNELAEVMLNSTQKITADLRSFQRDQHAAQTSTAIDLYRTDAENKAKSGDIIGATDSQMTAVELTNSLERSGLLSPKAAEKQRNDITRDIEDQAIYGEFARQMNKGSALSFIAKFRKVKEMGDRDPDYRKKMEAEMLGMMKKAQAMDDDARKREDDERKALWRKTEQELVTLDLQGGLTAEWLEDKVIEGSLDPKAAAKYKKAASLDGPEFSDAVAVSHYKADLLSFSELEIRTDPLLSRPDRDKLIADRRRLESDKGNWRRTMNGSEGARRINQAFGIIKGVDTRISKEKAQRAGMVLTRYFNEVESLPLEEREMKATQIADDLVREVSGEIQSADLKKAQDKLLDFPYQTPEEIDAADLGSEETKVLKRQLERIQKKIKRLGGGQ